MKSEQIEVKGLKELERALLALQKEYGGKSGAQALRPAVVAAIKPLKAKLQDDTPVFYNSTTVLAGRVGYFGNNVWKRALHMEYGTVNLSANHTLEQVFDSESRAMIRRFSKTLGPAIEKKAKALNRKRGST